MVMVMVMVKVLVLGPSVLDLVMQPSLYKVIVTTPGTSPDHYHPYLHRCGRDRNLSHELRTLRPGLEDHD